MIPYLDPGLRNPISNNRILYLYRIREFVTPYLFKSAKKKIKQQGPSVIQEQQFKYIWNLMKEKQDSEMVTLKDLIKAVAIYMKI